MWEALHEIAKKKSVRIGNLVTEVARNRQTPSLTAAIRIYIVDFYRTEAARAAEHLLVKGYTAGTAGVPTMMARTSIVRSA